MKLQFISWMVLTATASSVLSAQSQHRWVVVPAYGPLARANAGLAFGEELLTDALTASLTTLSGITLIDRASVDKVLKEQNFQASDRSSPETAVKIGKLLGAGEIVLLELTNASYTLHPEQSGNTTSTKGTVELAASARLIDIETGVILLQPTSSFEDSVLVSETSRFIGVPFRRPPGQKTTGGDPKVIEDNEWKKADEAVVKELTAKLSAAASGGPVPKLETAMVAGIANGSVYINRGSSAGIKAGDKFQVVREVGVGLTDPQTGKPIVERRRVCILTVVDLSESSSSGTCQGGIPQPKDVAQPLNH
ncbi:MAG: CsgG/HfaB family protein [Bryobacteraceae bacterium]